MYYTTEVHAEGTHVELLTSSVDDISSWSLCWQPLSSTAELASIRGVGQCATVVGPAVVMGTTELHHKHILAWLLGDQVVRDGIGEHNLSWPPPGKREKRSEEGKGRRRKGEKKRRKGWRRRGGSGKGKRSQNSQARGGKETDVCVIVCESSEEPCVQAPPKLFSYQPKAREELRLAFHHQVM